jgi:1-acyl-sn-glycerol-3-phosphate acyltransferase
MAPEMRITRQPGMRQARPGISFLVQRTGVPVLPVGITGTPPNFMQEILRLRRPRLTMRVGNLISLPEIGENRKADMQRNADIVMANIAMLLPEKYRGYYSDYETFLA